MSNIENALQIGGYLGGISKQKYLDMEKLAANGAALAAISNRTSGMSAGFFDLFNGITTYSTGILDTTKTKATSPLTAGDTNLISKVDTSTASTKWFATGQQITIQDDVNKEYVTVTNGGISTENATYDRSTPTTVVASAYTTSASARPQVLSNGWIVSTVQISTTGFICYKSIDNGATWTVLHNALSSGFTSVQGIATCAHGNYVYVMVNFNNWGEQVYRISTDGSAVGTTIESTQTTMGTCSLAINSTGTELHACWCSKNSSYPNSFNIRYAKGTIAGDGSVTWGSVQQLQSFNASGNDCSSPCIVMQNGNPNIVYAWTDGTNRYVRNLNYNGSLWTRYDIYYSTYTQSTPNACVTSDGVIHVIWYGLDVTESSASNIRYSKSTDGGVTWSAMLKLTTGNTYSQYIPSITFDNVNNLYVLWRARFTESATYAQIRKIVYSSGLWGSIINLTTNTTADALHPSICSNYQNFTDPICIYQDNQTPSVKFRGIFSTTTYDPHLEVTPLQNNYKTNVWCYRSLGNVDTVNGRLGFSSGFTSSTTYDRSTPTTVVASAYDTSGNGGRKLVRLSNGWLVAGVYDSTGNTLRFYVSKDNSSIYTQLCTSETIGAGSSFALVSSGTKVWFLISRQSTLTINYNSFDATTVSNVNLGAYTLESQTALGSGCSIAIDSLGYLYATWCSKNATYPNSFNIRYSKSTDGGVTWSAVTQITTLNTVNEDLKNPSIVCLNNGNPRIICDLNYSTSEHGILCYSYSGSSWNGGVYVYNAGATSYIQSNPSSLTKKYGSNIGRIWTGWHGLDSTDTIKQNVRVNYSDDSGATWNTATKITTGNTVDRKNVSLTEDSSGNIYAIYEDNGTLVYQVCLNGTTTFGGLTTIGAGTNASALDNSSGVNFSKPLIIYMSSSVVKFFGLWSDITFLPLLEESVVYNITPAVSSGQIASWIQYSNDVNFTIDSKFSIINSGNEIFLTPTKKTTVVDVDTKEDQYTIFAPVGSKIAQRIVMTRANTGVEKYVTKLLGALG